MMKVLKLVSPVFVCSVVAFGATTSLAAGSKIYNVYGVGNLSCGSFIDAVDNELKSEKAQGTEFEMLSWAQGYLSHFNLSDPSTESILGGTDSEGASQWIKNFCRAHPLQPFSDAVEGLISASWSSRKIHATKKQ